MSENELLIAPSFESKETGTLGRSFYREDIGFGKIEGLRDNPVAIVYFYDLEKIPRLGIAILIKDIEVITGDELREPEIQKNMEKITATVRLARDEDKLLFLPQLEKMR